MPLKTKIHKLEMARAGERKVVKRAAEFVHVVLSTGGLKRMPTGQVDRLTDAFLALELSLGDLHG